MLIFHIWSNNSADNEFCSALQVQQLLYVFLSRATWKDSSIISFLYMSNRWYISSSLLCILKIIFFSNQFTFTAWIHAIQVIAFVKSVVLHLGFPISCMSQWCKYQFPLSMVSVSFKHMHCALLPLHADIALWAVASNGTVLGRGMGQGQCKHLSQLHSSLCSPAHA